jgi:hypothetical protein
MTNSSPPPNTERTINVRRIAPGLYCLDDIHQALGGNPNHSPATYLTLDSTGAVIDAIGAAVYRDAVSATTPRPRIELIQQGAETYVHEDIAFDYVLWLSPSMNGMARLYYAETRRILKNARGETNTLAGSALAAVLRAAAPSAERSLEAEQAAR